MYQKAVDDFDTDLANLNIVPDETGKLSFHGSQIEGNKATAVISRVIKDLRLVQ